MAKDDSRYSPGPLPALIFSSRWLQLPLCLGLDGSHHGRRAQAAAAHR
jgi:hypothetical protein